MSSYSDLLVSVKAAEKHLYQFGGPILMFLGVVGCILNSLVFSQKNLRKNPCSIYFLAFNTANFFYIFSSLLPLTLNSGYNSDISTQYLVLCRIRFYVTVLANALSASYLILASIDRILITSSNARTRQRSHLRYAYICLIVGISFWTVFHIHALIATNIIAVAPRTFICYFQLGVYLAFISYYALIKELSTLVLLTLCGFWSIKNIRSSARRIIPMTNTSGSRTAATSTIRSTSSKDHQLMLMLLMDIIFYVSFSLTFACFLAYQQITQYDIKNLERVQIENSIRNFCLFGVGISFSSSCYANLLVSKTFRTELKKIFFTTMHPLH